MTRVWRFVLTCLLGIAIPVQGFAAYSMAWCGPAHHSAALSQAQEAHHHQAVVSGHESHHAQVMSSTDSSQEPSQASTGKANKCSACASCCSATALPSLPVVLTSLVLKDDFAPLEPSGIAVYLSEGLERPPRIVLA